MAAAAAHLRLHSPLVPGLQTPPIKSRFLHLIHVRRNPNLSFSTAAALPSPGSEEQRWLREEQRWLREEQRWLREEARWIAERESLLREISALRHRSESPAQGVRVVPAAAPQPVLAEHADVKEMVLEEVHVEDGGVTESSLERTTLRTGMEGEAVREMQEALEKLGFYSGEEDMEFSSFSNGTERAVKTWQASIRVPEDGIMTTELLKKLLSEPKLEISVLEVNADKKGDSWRDGVNGTAVTSITEIMESVQTEVHESGDAEDDESHHRVYLLGENRWEDPSRLTRRNNPISTSKAVSSATCLSCRGEGRVICTEEMGMKQCGCPKQGATTYEGSNPRAHNQVIVIRWISTYPTDHKHPTHSQASASSLSLSLWREKEKPPSLRPDRPLSSATDLLQPPPPQIPPPALQRNRSSASSASFPTSATTDDVGSVSSPAPFLRLSQRPSPSSPSIRGSLYK